ncbi:MAG: MoxR family ATPase [Oscillibacter sp.]|nr:MoxR family ATPase [Oscillibacter sp.]
MDTYAQRAAEVVRQVERALFGKAREIREVLLAVLANGHILLEDIPGVGKTTLAMAFSKTLDLEYRRVQFTPDVLPSDLTGFSVYRREQEAFVYQPGIVFCNLLLADELNRTSPKTQSALLEAMQEGQVTAEGVTRKLPEPFLVIATQNPLGSAGTQPLPESEADRFAVSLSLGYPDLESELSMARSVGVTRPVDALWPVLSRAELLAMQTAIHDVYIHEKVYRYLTELVRATRNHVNVAQGAGPRATIALVKLSKAAAWYEGRDFVTPADVLEQFPYVAAHRLTLNANALTRHITVRETLQQIAGSVRKPPIEARR